MFFLFRKKVVRYENIIPVKTDIVSSIRKSLGENCCEIQQFCPKLLHVEMELKRVFQLTW